MACMLSCNPRTIHRLVARGVIPCYRVGRALRFDPERVFEALAHESIDSHELQVTEIM
jgi:excisionase family DNA binding protein